MSAQEAHEHLKLPIGVPISPDEQELAKVIPFPVKAGIGELAVTTFANSGIVIHHGLGSERYLRRHNQTLSAAPHSHIYGERVKELGNKGKLL